MLSEIVMAVTLTDRGAIGCAYYVARNETLYFMEDVQMGDANMVDSCKLPNPVDTPCTQLTDPSKAFHRPYRGTDFYKM